jgi:predicted nucleic acid-binding protein
MNFVLDTNILIHLVRQTPNILQKLMDKGVFGIGNNTFISIVSIAEIQAFAYRNNWGVAKLKILQQLIGSLTPIPIDNQSIIDDYVQIDVFSQGRHRVYALPANTSARNMGKNDIWVAATTTFAAATLVTTDADFDHLETTFFKIEKFFI